MIKKIGLLLLVLIISFTGVNKLNAASGTISVTSSANKVVVGNTFTVTVRVSSSVALGSWEYTMSYDSGIVKLTSGSANIVDYGDGSLKSKTYTYKFKALKSGSAKITVKAYGGYAWDESKLSMSAGAKTVSIITQQDLIASYSKDNNLKSLTVDTYELTPAFNKDTLEYTVNVPSTVEKINLNAVPNDSAASVNGVGEKEVSEGENVFELVVTAENGSTKTYKVNVKVEDPNPITIKTKSGIEGTIVKRSSSLTKPSIYTETTVNINGEEVPAFTSEITKLTLVGAKVEDKIELFIYNEEKNTYEIYKEIKFNGVILYPINYDKYPEKYIKKTIKINDIETEAYTLNEKSGFYLIYGMNIETGEENLYQFDQKENTISRYNNEPIEEVNLKLENYTFIIIILGFESILLIIILIFLLVSKNKAKKIYKKIVNKYETKKKSEDKTEIKEQTKNITKQDKAQAKKDKKLSDTKELDKL